MTQRAPASNCPVCGNGGAMERRIAVTGLGVVSPLGNDVQTFWENIKAGKNGISGITKFDCTDYRVKVAAEVFFFSSPVSENSSAFE